MKLKLTHSNIRTLIPQNSRYDVHDTALAGYVARVHPSGKISYLLKYNDISGTRKNYTIGIDGFDGLSPSTARKIAEELKQNLKKGIDPQEEKKRQKAIANNKKQNTVRSFFEGRYQHHLENNKASSQAESRRVIFAEFADLLDQPINDITPDWVRNWRQRRRKDGLSPHTLKRYNAELDVLLAIAVEYKIIPHHPLKGELRPIHAPARSNIKDRYLSAEESKKFREALVDRDNHLKARAASGRQWKLDRGYDVDPCLEANRFADHLTPMCLISLNTGVRQGELFQLRWSDLSVDNRFLELRGETTKNSEPRSIPLNKEAIQTLMDWQQQTKDSGLIFPNSNGDVFQDVKSHWKSLMKRWKLKFKTEPPRFTWHDMRHDFASQLVMKGIPIDTVRRLLGHSTLEMTLRYAHLSDTSLTDAVATLDSLQH